MTATSTPARNPDIPRSRAAEAALVTLGAAWPSVGLDDVARAASLQTRTDHKYLVRPELLDAVLGGGRWSVLAVDRQRLSTYESVYFDTLDLMLFRAHRQGRRRRYKVRLRRYLDSDATMLELKTKGRRGATVKSRWDVDSPGCARSHNACTRRPCDHDDLPSSACQHVVDALSEQRGLSLPDLRSVLVTQYRRMTFVDVVRGQRLTCDIGLRFHGNGRDVDTGDLVLVESKVAGRVGEVDRKLLSLGVRPVQLSKYAVGTALVQPELSANRWNPVLQRYFRD